jgi:hypothetical protein
MKFLDNKSAHVKFDMTLHRNKAIKSTIKFIYSKVAISRKEM